MPLFITFEGVEGCGKSTQSRLLYRRLTKLAIPVLLTHEPGGTALGEKVTRLLKWSKQTGISPLPELFLFEVSRAQHIEEIIRPALKQGKVVICDRFADSSTAYQGYGRGIDLETVRDVNRTTTQGIAPDLTILLDVPVKGSLARKKGKPDRFHAENLAFHRRIHEGFLKLAKEEPARWLVINGTQNKKKIAGIIWEKVSSLLSKQV
jgi:dTMP kinase